MDIIWVDPVLIVVSQAKRIPVVKKNFSRKLVSYLINLEVVEEIALKLFLVT